MDFPDNENEVVEEEEGVAEMKEKEGSLYMYLRISLLILLSVLATLSLPIFGLIVEFSVESISNWNPIYVPTKCKIVSSSVDIRSSKVCELGLLYYKARQVFYSYSRNKFRCQYDYYWASVFEVEYFDHSGQQRLALAEAPNEALPKHCRPNFSVAWLTKYIFKVNETYDCWYTMGFSKIYLNTDALFNCYAMEPSIIEMLQRYFFISTGFASPDMLTGPFFTHRKWNIFLAIILIISSYTIAKLLYKLKSILHQIPNIKIQTLYRKAIVFRRVCFFIAYFSFMSWLALQYIKWFGIPDILKDDYSW